MKVAALVVSVVIVVSALTASSYLAYDLTTPERACDRATPYFEGLAVEDAEVAWPPPLVRCTLVDTDPPKRNQRSRASAWGWAATSSVIVLDSLGSVAFVWLIIALRRRSGASPPP